MATGAGIQQFEHRGHSLTIDSGWKDVAQIALDFIQGHRRAHDEDELAEARGWSAYAAELRGVLGAVIASSGVEASTPPSRSVATVPSD